MDYLNSSTLLLAAVTVAAAFFYYIQTQRWRSKLPPGPPVHLFYGHSKDIQRAGGLINFFKENQKIYGNVCISLCSISMVM